MHEPRRDGAVQGAYVTILFSFFRRWPVIAPGAPPFSHCPMSVVPPSETGPIDRAVVGAVVIGRNEGERLRACLSSVLPSVQQVVYVDSGSSDGSVELAQALGAHVVALEMTQPFTAARARNAGWRKLLSLAPGLRYVQFIDGDCEVVPGWMDAALGHMEGHERCVVVCGRRRERYPERSIYNRMCDIEWNTPVGEALSCGGDALFRVDALTQVGGYRDSLIAGEEPELCLRLRRQGGRVHRIDYDMTRHDAAITRWGQWWRRTVRAGHAYAEGAWLHGASPDRHWVKPTVRALVWGVLLPLLIVVCGLLAGPWGWLLALVYPAQWLRLSLRDRSPQIAFFTVMGKFAEAQGVLTFLRRRMLGRAGRLIEYK